MTKRRSSRDLALMDAVREACVDAAVAAYEDAGMRGVCGEGRWECAVSAIRAVDLSALRPGAAGGRGAFRVKDQRSI